MKKQHFGLLFHHAEMVENKGWIDQWV